ncbi:uncharacterized protein LOC127831230 [Dreissena polymorpha]|uniref:uncharacterized protein LOC127831230 n=1 Tax=Dreissena polymorpha TaxID=45954 RepID=UPI0022651055|nr:uncharacterized protein LOC127831230 [Dreissena polymorpha]
MDYDGITTTSELMSVACSIVDTIWSPIELKDVEEKDEYCFCKQSIDDEETPMIECEGQDCSNGKWFHFECVGMKEDTVPEGSWYCSAECRSKLSSYCYCKRQIQDQPMVECCHSLCANGRWFHAKCIGLTEDTLPGEVGEGVPI